MEILNNAPSRAESITSTSQNLHKSSLNILLEFLATLRLCASVPNDVAVLVEKKDVQFYIQALEGELKTVLYLHVRQISQNQGQLEDELDDDDVWYS